jgi:hypothetical protein
MKGGGNRWTDFVRDFAKMNNTTYMCALSNPECKQEYRAKFGNPKKLSKKAEQQTMGENDPREIKKKQDEKKKLIKKKVISLAKKRDEVIQKAEQEKMAAEDIPAPAPTPAPSPVAPLSAVAKKRGRPAKYSNAEDARLAKIKNTIEASKRRQEAKRQAKAEAKREKQENITMKIEDIKPKRGRPKKGGAVVTPPPSPTNVPAPQAMAPRPPLAHLNAAIHIVQQPFRRDLYDRFTEIVAGRFDEYERTINMFFNQVPPNSMIRQAFDRNGRAYFDRYRVGGRSRVLMCGGMEDADLNRLALMGDDAGFEEAISTLSNPFASAKPTDEVNCPYCNKPFRYKGLSRHIAQVHGTDMPVNMRREPTPTSKRGISVRKEGRGMDMTPHLVNEINNYRGILHHLKKMLRFKN